MAEVISQSKIFVDFNAGTGGGTTIAGGAIWCQYLTKVDAKDAGSVEGVKGIGSRGFVGVREKAGGGTANFTENRVDKPQVNWRKLKRTKKYFTITIQDENGGPREKYLRCRVSKVDHSLDDEGQHIDEIEVIYAEQV